MVMRWSCDLAGWEWNPSKRPQFAELHIELNDMSNVNEGVLALDADMHVGLLAVLRCHAVQGWCVLLCCV